MTSHSNKLVMRTGPTPGKTFALSKNEIYIGRDITNDIVINDAEVSRKHARLTLQTGGYILEDLGSTNGTFVDTQRLTGPYMLRPGQTIMLADSVSLLFEPAPMDPEATRVAPSVGAAAGGVPVPYMSPADHEYAGQIPLSPGEEAPLEERDSSPMWLLAGTGCLLVIACVVIFAILYYIDANSLWCSIPVFSDFLPCP